jgi:thioredoxin-related protein
MKHLTPALSALAALLLFAAPALAGGDGWLTNLEEAKKQAKKEGKDVLIDFTGSDWCGWCIRLKKEVWDTEGWKAEGPKRYVLVELDFPRKKEQSEETKKYNRALNDLFGVKGYPTIALLDSEGRPYAMTGYQQGGPEAYLKHLEELGQRKGQIKELVAAAEKSENVAKGLDEVMSKLEEWRVAFGYTKLQEKIVAADPKNEAGLGLKYAKALAKGAKARGDDEAYAKHLEVVKSIDPKEAQALEDGIAAAALGAELEGKLTPLASKGNWKGAAELLEKDYLKKHEAGVQGQVVRFYLAICKLRGGDKPGAVETFKAAKALAPESPMAEQIDQLMKKIGG